MKRDYDKLLQAGNKAQLEKLRENEHKRGFDGVYIEYATKRLVEELTEMREAITTGNPAEVRREAADIANFAHMIILKCDMEINKIF